MESLISKKITIDCPGCKNPSIYSIENSFRPFCSERCQIADRANWAEETYKIPEKESSSSTSDTETTSSSISFDDD